MAISNDQRAPILSVEFDSTNAFQGPAILKYDALIIAQPTAGGTIPAFQLERVTSADQSNKFFGEGSLMSRMVKAWRDNNQTTNLFCMSIPDDGAGVSASGAFVIGGTATAQGSIVAYIGGDRIPIVVNVGDTATVLGDRLAAAVASTIPVTAVNVTGTVTCTAKNKGETGNGIYLDAFYNTGEELPLGLTLTINTMSGGLNNPDVQQALDLLADRWFQIFVTPYTDATNLTSIETELADRFGPVRQNDGMHITSIRRDFGDLATFGNTRNSPHNTIIHSFRVLTSTFEVGAAYAGQIAKEGSADPARQFTTLPLNGVLAPRELDRFTAEENNSLLFDGISTFVVDNGGVMRIQMAITTYQKNALGSDDIAFLEVNTLLTLLFLRFDFRTQIGTKYPRAKLAADGTQFGPGQQVITPSKGKAEAINIFRGWELLGLVENVDQFKRDLICVRSKVNNNRLDWILPPDLIDRFRVGAADMQFLLLQPASA